MAISSHQGRPVSSFLPGIDYLESEIIGNTTDKVLRNWVELNIVDHLAMVCILM